MPKKIFFSTPAFSFHRRLKGKIAISPKIRLKKKNLALFYTPGVGEVARYLAKNKKEVSKLTGKGNAVAVVSDGSAVLGLGNLGPEAALPVLEGKCLLFKELAGIDAYPIVLATQKVEEIVETVKNFSPSFAAINLEDIAAPFCFEIEEKLRKILPIPVVHDDQHATAIAVLAGLFNALFVVGKKLSESKIVIVGCGAAGTAVAKLLLFAGAKNLLLLDRKGVIFRGRKDLPSYKKKLAEFTNPENVKGDLETVAKGADVLIGLSVGRIFTRRVIKKMNFSPIVFALANPEPEVRPPLAKKWGAKIVATGRSDYSNQVNNALVFPGLFRGLLSSKEKILSEEKKLEAAKVLASLIKKPSPEKILPSLFNQEIVSSLAKIFH